MAWETSLNESNYNAAWAKEMNRIAKEEYPTDGVSYAWTAGCIQWDAWDIGLGILLISSAASGIPRSI